MDKQKLIDLINQAAKDRERAKETFHKCDGMITAYENILKELESPVGT